MGLAKPEEARVDYTRGIVMIKKVRVGLWLAEGWLEIKNDKLTEAGINVEVNKLERAVAELMQE